MAGKSKRSREDFKQEDVLQAVVIADSFNVRFSPVTRQKPRALLPLVNIPLIDYTLEFLCNAGIQQVIVFCCIHADQIKQHIRESKWHSTHSCMDVSIVVSEGCMSVGDALRDIDAKSLINSDFVLVNGDMVANVNLAPIIHAHKARRLKEKTAVMTMLFKAAPPGHPTRCAEEEVIMAVEKQTDRIISYQKVNKLSKFQFPLEIFDGAGEVELRFDLLDCHISICSPVVPTLFTDNFDYLSREHFVKGILVNEEILGNTIHMCVLKDEYAARVSNLHMYDAVSHDVLNRWSYPMVPDKNLTDCTSNKYTHGRHNIYLHKDVTLARGCVLEENVVIGQGSRVGSNTHIANSVIGKNVQIGDSVRISGAYIWDGCVIGDQCRLHTCLLDTGVRVTDRVHIQPGCVLATNVKVGPEVTLSGATLWTSEPVADDFSDEQAELDHSLVGTDGIAYLHEQDPESDDELRDLAPWGSEHVTDDDDQSDESTSSEQSSRGNTPPPDESRMFYDEVLSTLQRAIDEHIGTDNLVLEINSVKSAYGIYINEVNVLVTRAVLELPFEQHGTLQPPQYLVQLKKNLCVLLAVLENYIRSAESQSDCLYSIEDTCLDNPTIRAVLVKLLHYLYDNELLSEESIVTWYKHVRADDNSDERQQLRQQVETLVTWLQEAEEESESDEH